MSDNSFTPDRSYLSTTGATYGRPLDVRYVDFVGMVMVEIGDVRLYLTPGDAAVVAEKIPAALDLYAATLKTVA
ncbi:hypothetical protein ACFQ9R_33990 [Nocardia sp. NPDC056541]|uniref:hypothetical protein n=1 Tax=unclassified Nocardia TaxID=2637762 RepID=UPI000701A938|nr:hypothetical protein [Nocardia sp. Root136]KQY30523.1 hypothetical protein ASD42_24965 [Nocardia sp. Root136]